MTTPADLEKLLRDEERIERRLARLAERKAEFEAKEQAHRNAVQAHENWLTTFTNGLAFDANSHELNSLWGNLWSRAKRLRAMLTRSEKATAEVNSLIASLQHMQSLSDPMNRYQWKGEMLSAHKGEHVFNGVKLGFPRWDQYYGTGIDLRATDRFLEGTVTARRRHMDPMIIGLVKNSLRFLSSMRREDRDFTGIIEIDSPSENVITVSDNGPGIPEDLLERVFDAHYSSRNNGTGLGLFVARMALRNSGYDIYAEMGSELGGARIVINLNHGAYKAPKES